VCSDTVAKKAASRSIDGRQIREKRTMSSRKPAPGVRACLDPIEHASRDELSALQIQRLKKTLHHVYDKVPHYRQKFDAAGVHPDDCRELKDLAKFPFTAKADLRQNYPYGMFAVPREQVVRVHASSGTTGKPTVVGYTKNDIEMWAGVMARSIYAAGGGPGDIAHVGYGYGLFTGGLGAHYGAEKLGCTVVPIRHLQKICANATLAAFALASGLAVRLSSAKPAPPALSGARRHGAPEGSAKCGELR
jgi:phenylacetate-coenzyme A ligase PaaK-like adenylate-forming protein